MKKLLFPILLFLTILSCNSDKKVSSEEYLVLNKSINEILRPMGMTFFDSTEQFNEIARQNGVTTSNITERESKILEKAVGEKNGFQFMIADTLSEISSKDPEFLARTVFDSIKPAKEKLPSAIFYQTEMKFPEYFEKLNEVTANKDKFLGKITISRVIFDKSKEKAVVRYIVSETGKQSDNLPRFMVLKKYKDEWIIKR